MSDALTGVPDPRNPGFDLLGNPLRVTQASQPQPQFQPPPQPQQAPPQAPPMAASAPQLQPPAQLQTPPPAANPNSPIGSSIANLFIPQAAAAESGGNANAQNPSSSASGILGFTNDTWNRTVAKYGDQYGLTLDGKNDPRQQEQAAKALVDNEYVPWLQSKGLQNPTSTDIYQMHFWGQPNMDKMMKSSGDDTLKSALGDAFPGVYKANATLFGHDPNITVTDATNAVAGAFNRNGVNNVSVANKPIPSGAGFPGDPSAAPQDLPQGQPVNPMAMMASGPGGGPPMPMQGGGPGAYPQPQGLPQLPDPNSPFAGGSFFSKGNLLRFASGLQGPFTGAAKAMVDGQQQDFQNRGSVFNMGLEQQKTNAQVIGEASKLMEMGVPAPQAIGITTGQIPPGQAAQALQGVALTGGKGTKGDTYLTPDGHTIQETQHPYGAPTLVDMSTGQRINTLPPGTFRSQDAYIKALQGGEGQAENAAIEQARSAPKTLSILSNIEDMIPQIATGQDLLSTVRRNFTNLTGLPLGGNDATAQQLTSQLFDQLKVARTSMLKGFGRVDLPMVRAVQAAGPNWMQNPDALRAVVKFAQIEPQRQMQMVKDWQTAQANGQGGMGYRKFSMQWDQAHPYEADMKAALAFPTSQTNPGTPQAGPSVIRYDNQGNRIQ